MPQIQSPKPIANRHLIWRWLFVFAFLISAFTPLTANAAHLQTAGGGALTWASAEVGGYGALPGATAPRLGSASSLLAATIWRGHYLDATGFYGLGARVYDPQSGRFLSPDPLGHSSSLSLYDYANGDPVNGLDPDGRFGKTADASAFGFGSEDEMTAYNQQLLGENPMPQPSFLDGLAQAIDPQGYADMQYAQEHPDNSSYADNSKPFVKILSA